MVYSISLLLFVTTVLAIYGTYLIFLPSNRHIDKLKLYDENYQASHGEDQQKYKIKRKRSKINLPQLGLNKEKRRLRELQLVQGDVQLTLEELLMIKLILSVLVPFMTYIVTGEYIIAIVLLVVGMKLPQWVINKRRRKRTNAFDEQLNDGLILIANALKSGYSFMQSLAIASKEIQAPFGKELNIMLKESNLGMPMDQALNNLVDRTNSQDLKLVVNAILIQKDVGGNLSEIIENISETIRERQKIQNELKTLTAQGKLSGSIVMMMPLGLGLVIYMLNKEFIMLLFTTKVGLIMLGVALVNQLIGWLIIKKIITVDM